MTNQINIREIAIQNFNTFSLVPVAAFILCMAAENGSVQQGMMLCLGVSTSRYIDMTN